MTQKLFENRIYLSSPTMHGEEMKYVKEAYDTNWMSTVGENINELERIASSHVGTEYAVALASGTSALHLAVKLSGVKPGDKVFCTDMTFAATLNAVVYEGATPVFIDSERATWNMDPDALERAFALYPNTKAVMLVHLYGTPARIDESIAERVRTLTSLLYDILRCRGIIRIDYIITEGNKLNLLEINTTPGMTATSFIPQQVRAAGLDIKDVLTEIIEDSF